jgi:hypothetical protein
MEIHNMGSCSEYTAAVNTRALFIFLPTPAELLDAKFYGSAGTLIWVSLMIIEGDVLTQLQYGIIHLCPLQSPYNSLPCEYCPFYFEPNNLVFDELHCLDILRYS